MEFLIIEAVILGAERLMNILLVIDKSNTILGICKRIQASANWFRQNKKPDLIMMDIELSDGQCFEIFKQQPVEAPVIFTTSYDEYALKAFKVNSIDYLLKPIKKEELMESLDKLKHLKRQYNKQDFNIDQLIAQLHGQSNNYRKRFLVKHGQKLTSIDTDEIAFFYAEDRLTLFRTWDNRQYLADYTLEEIGEMLDPADFRRINRAFIVHIKSIAAIHNYFNGKLKLELKPKSDKEVIISRESVADFKVWMGK